MRHSIRTLDGVAIVGIAGNVDRRTAGHLIDVLVGCTGDGTTKLVVDLSGVDLMTRAGVRGLVVAAKLLQPLGGEMRICGARRVIEVHLQSLGFHRLLQCDPTLESSLARLRDGAVRSAGAPAEVVPFGVAAPARRPEPQPVGAEWSGAETAIRRRQAYGAGKQKPSKLQRTGAARAASRAAPLVFDSKPRDRERTR